MAVNISFSGKRVLVTGGGKGIGRDLVEKLYKDGAIVYTVDKDETLMAQLKSDFPSITAVSLDISDWAKTATAVESFGPIDHLINNAGIAGYGQLFMDVTEEAIDKTFAVNYKSIVNISQIVAKGMIDNKIKGSIVNLASLMSRFTVGHAAIYSSTKAAVVMLTKSMALELGEHNIRVNCVCPTFVNTDMMRGASEMAELWISRAVFKRPVEVNEVTDVIFFLLSEKAAMITGEQVFIDGGFSCQ